VEYPFVVGQRELTPRAVTEISPGDSLSVLLGAHHLEGHSLTGLVQPSVSAEAVNAKGVSRNLGDVAIVATATDPATDGSSFLISIRLPEDMHEGFYDLRVTVGDTITGQRVGHSTAFRVTGG